MEKGEFFTAKSAEGEKEGKISEETLHFSLPVFLIPYSYFLLQENRNSPTNFIV